MTLIDIIKAAITDAGGDGLVNGFAECGCSIDDLAPMLSRYANMPHPW
jgi:hypothetical protein